jgi:membrane protease YdiL (CAAX protease family)
MPLSPDASRHAWPIAGLLLAAWTVRVLCEPWLSAIAPDGVLRQAVYDALRIALFVLLPLAVVTIAEGRPIASPFGLPPGQRPRLAWALVAAWIAGLLVIEWLARDALPVGASAAHVPPVIFAALVTAAAEEFAFRGVLLPRFVARHGAVTGQLVCAIVFVLAHWPAWLLLQGAAPAELLDQSARLVLLSLILGLVTRLSGSLLPAIVLHADNNIIVALSMAPLGR